jgi:predicted RNA-binding Zn-ribbon protein involved in translation (DUF1610 family)
MTNCPNCGSRKIIRVDNERTDGYCVDCKKFFKGL